MNFCFVDNGQLNSALTATADAIREKTKGIENIAFSLATGFAEAINTIPAGIKPEGFHFSTTFPIVEKYNTTDYEFPTIMSVGLIPTASYYYSVQCAIVKVYLSECTIVGRQTFSSCFSLKTAIIPKCTKVHRCGFQNCRVLESINFPLCSYIDDSAFYGCNKLSLVNMPLCESIGYAAFCGCYSLTEANFPLVTGLSGYTFFNCSALSSVNLPACLKIGNSDFNRCSSLTMISLPNLISIYGSTAFGSCTKLMSVYFMGSNFITLSSSVLFTSTPIVRSSYLGTFGSIYVPASMLASYKPRTNWTTFSDRMVGI